MNSLTLGEFRRITKNLPDDYKIETTIEFGNPNSLIGVVNEVHICPKEHTHSGESFITLTQSKESEGKDVMVKQLFKKNTWI